MKDKTVAEIYDLLGYTEEVEATGLQIREIFITCKKINELIIPSDYIDNYGSVQSVAMDFNREIKKIQNIKNNTMKNYKMVISDFNPDTWRKLKENTNIYYHRIASEPEDVNNNLLEDLCLIQRHIFDIPSFPDDQTLTSKAERAISEYQRNHNIKEYDLF